MIADHWLVKNEPETAPNAGEAEREEIVNVSRDNRASIHRRGAISAEVYTDEEVKNYTRKVENFKKLYH